MNDSSKDRVQKEMKEKGLAHLSIDAELCAIILRSEYKNRSVCFFTPGSFSQQMGYLPHKKGDVIRPHEHRVPAETVQYTQEVLIVREGRMRVDFYDRGRRHRASEELGPGDIVMLCSGGHGFQFLEDTVLVEIKQGPYAGTRDRADYEEG